MIKDRAGNIIATDSAQGGALDFLYKTALGRLITKLLTRKFISELGRLYMESALSKGRIKRLIKEHSIDISEYESREYSSFNDFFTRKILEGKRKIDTKSSTLIAPADSKLTAYKIKKDSRYRIKGCDYSIVALLGGDEKEACEYYGGDCLVFRLSVDNYHRYCYTDNGTELSHRFVPGLYHTVNPIALEKYDVYGKNCREITLLQTESFGRVAYIEVGAMMVGKINNTHKKSFSRGEEKGYFSFGGSTIVMLYKKGAIRLDDDILTNSADETETVVLYGETIGTTGDKDGN